MFEVSEENIGEWDTETASDSPAQDTRESDDRRLVWRHRRMASICTSCDFDGEVTLLTDSHADHEDENVSQGPDHEETHSATE